MPQRLSDEDAARLILEGGKPPKPPNRALELGKRALKETGAFAGGALPAFGSGIFDTARGMAEALAASQFPEVRARQIGEQVEATAAAAAPQPTTGVRALGPGQLPPRTVEEAQQLGRTSLPYEVANAAMFGLPGIIERGVTGTFGSRTELSGPPPGMQGPALPITSTPVPVSTAERGAAFGRAAGELAPFAAEPGVEAVRRFRARPMPQPTPGAAGPAEFTPEGPAFSPRALPEPSPGVTTSKVQPGFSATESTYRVSIADKQVEGGPKQEFGQHKDVVALSRQEAIQKVRDELGADADRYDWKADPVKGTARALTPKEIRERQQGKQRQPQPRAVQAESRLATAAEGQGPTAKKPIEVGEGPALQAERLARERRERLSSKKAFAAEGQPPSGKVTRLGPGSEAGFREAPPLPDKLKAAEELPEVPKGFAAVGEDFEVTLRPKGSQEVTAKTTIKAPTEEAALARARKRLGRDADKYDYEVNLPEPPEEGGPPSGAKPVSRKPKPEGVSAPLRPEKAETTPTPSPGEAVAGVERARAAKPRAAAKGEPKIQDRTDFKNLNEGQAKRAAEIAAMSTDEIIALGKQYDFIGPTTKAKPMRRPEAEARRMLESSPGMRHTAAVNIARREPATRAELAANDLTGKRVKTFQGKGTVLRQYENEGAYGPMLEVELDSGGTHSRIAARTVEVIGEKKGKAAPEESPARRSPGGRAKGAPTPEAPPKGRKVVPERGSPEWDAAVKSALTPFEGAEGRLKKIASKSDEEIRAFLEHELGAGGGSGGSATEPATASKGGKNPSVRIGDMLWYGPVQEGSVQIKGKALIDEVRRLYGGAGEKEAAEFKEATRPKERAAAEAAPREPLWKVTTRRGQSAKTSEWHVQAATEEEARREAVRASFPNTKVISAEHYGRPVEYSGEGQNYKPEALRGRRVLVWHHGMGDEGVVEFTHYQGGGYVAAVRLEHGELLNNVKYDDLHIIDEGPPRYTEKPVKGPGPAERAANRAEKVKQRGLDHFRGMSDATLAGRYAAHMKRQFGAEGVKQGLGREARLIAKGERQLNPGDREHMVKALGRAEEAKGIPDWLRKEMEARGLKAGRILNTIDAAQARELLEQDPLIAEIRKVNPELADRALKGNVTREELEPFLHTPEATSTGRVTSVNTPSRSFEAEYQEIPLKELKPSHNPATFEPSSRYPFEQQRDYRANKLEQMKVIEMAKAFNPEYLLADTPTATDGPPIVSREGYVLGGNARTMALMRALDEGAITERQLQAAVQSAGRKFGMEGAGKNPGTIIVRRLTKHVDLEQLAKDTKALNEDFKMAVDPVSDAVSRANNLSGDTVDWISNALNEVGPEATLRADILDNPERLTALMRRLAEDQVVVSSELPRLLDPATNKLTPEGQRMIEAAVLGRVIKSPKMIREMSPSLKNTTLSALTELTRGEHWPAEWRLNNDVVNGLWLHHMAEKAGKNVDMMLEPQLYPEPFLDAVRENKVAVELARWFERNKRKPTALRTALQKFNRMAGDATSPQEMLAFGEAIDRPHEALNQAFDLKLSADEYGTGDGMVYLHAGLSPEALAPLWAKVGAKARQLRDWLFIPKDIREPYKEGESFREWWERGMYPRTGDSVRKWVSQTWQAFAKAALQNADTARFPYFHEQLDQFKVGAMAAVEDATNRMADVIHPILYRQDATGVFKRRPSFEIDGAVRQFQLLLGVTDMWARAKAGTLTPASSFPGWAKFSQAEVAAGLEAEVRQLMNTSSPAVKEAHQAWIRWMGELRAEMVKRGKLGESDRLGWAYAPNVINDLTWQQMWSVATGPLRVKEAVRPYIRQFVGHLRKHDPNMVRAGLQHATNVMLDNVLDDFSHSVGQAWDHMPQVWQRIEQIAARDGRKVADVAKETPIPEGMEIYQVGPKRHLWNPATVTEYVMDKVLQADKDLGLQFNNMWEVREFAGVPVRKGGKARPVYIMPKPIVDALGQFREARGPLDRLAAQFHRGVSWWKAIILASIYIPYAMTNAIGDVANVLHRLPGRGPLPGFGPMLKYGPRSVYDIIRASGPKEAAASPMLQLADQVGVRQNTRAIAEMADLRAHTDLRRFFRPQRAKVLLPAQKLFEVANDVLSSMMVVDSIREGSVRFAAWRYLMEKGFPAKRAERLVSEIIADYRNTDRFTGLARRSGIAPFAVWMRQMVPGWIRWVTGAKLGKYFEVPELEARTPAVMARAEKIANLRGITTEAALELMSRQAAIPPPNVPRPSIEPPKGTDPAVWKAVHSGRFTTGSLTALTLGIGVPMTMVWYWNNVLHPGLNKFVDDNMKKRMTYLVLPWWQTNDGRPLIWGVQSPLDAVLSFAGLGNPIDRGIKFAKAWQQGPGEVAKTAWDQLGESVGSMGSGLMDLAGPPIQTIRSAFETGDDLRREHLKDEAKRKTDWEILQRNSARLWGAVAPGASGIRAMQRQDLEGLPKWATGSLRQYPWGGLFYVPLSEEEKKRRRNRNRPPRQGLYPGVSTQQSTLKPMASGG